ncbi:hypothetical protein GWK91_05280 [Virgibacillus sp. MSP4-1]|uniref:hypothetical protein n=1 Tax=Virgibacillus sp. MSP4-1 TaxID=2700081 RepID=UPI0003A66044|nr:hypothetical protein [Virgibacillus sp. MSP4-1]QHS22400.1 hypothetical protein GWK91_05280 [Virgibacillus sp. MSP4-1]
MAGIAIYILSLFILYAVVSAAVRNGVDSSRLVRLLEKQEESNESTQAKMKSSFLDHDLDD